MAKRHHATDVPSLHQHIGRPLDVEKDGEAPVVLARSSHVRKVALQSKTKSRGWQETKHLLRSPANAHRLLRTVRRGGNSVLSP